MNRPDAFRDWAAPWPGPEEAGEPAPAEYSARLRQALREIEGQEM